MNTVWLRSAIAPGVIAHRGASSQAPENTLAALCRAVELGADMVELDVHLSSDRILVVIHDTTLDRTTSASGLVWQHTATQLRSFDAGSWFSPDFSGEGVPSLADVFRALPDGIGVNIEVKSPGDGDPRSEKELAWALLLELDASAGRRPIIISSFDYHLLRVINGTQGGLALAYLYALPQLPGTLSSKLASGVLKAIHPHHRLVTAGLVRKAHDMATAVNPWTIDSPDHIARLVAMGVDGIITNVPAVAADVVRSSRETPLLQLPVGATSQNR